MAYTTQDIIAAYQQSVGTGAATEADFVNYALSVGVTSDQLMAAQAVMLSPESVTASVPLSTTISTEAEAIDAYNQLASSGYSDDEIRAAADQIYGKQSDEDWAYLQSKTQPALDDQQLGDLAQDNTIKYLMEYFTQNPQDMTALVANPSYDSEGLPLLGGSEFLTPEGLAANGLYTTTLNDLISDGDNSTYNKVLTGYETQLTQPFQTPDNPYGAYYGTYDKDGNLTDVQFKQWEQSGGWFSDNLDWIGPALVLGAAGFGSGLFGLGGTAGADLAATAVGGVEGAASQLATTAFTNAINAGLPMSAALSAADVAAGLAGSGLTDAAILESALSSAADTASLGAVDAAGNVIGGGGSLTIDAGAGLGGSVVGMDTAGLDSLITDITNADVIEAETSITDPPTDKPITDPPIDKPTTPFPESNVLPGSTGTFKDFIDKLKMLPGPGDLNLSNVLGGALSAAGAKSIYDRLSGLGPQIRDAYTALGQDVQGQYGNISQGIQGNLGGLFGKAQQAGLGAYGAAEQIDLANLRQQEFDIMNAMMADPRAAQAAQIEDRRRAQGLGGLQSFNQAYSAQFTDPTTGNAYTVGADPAQVAMYKAWANQDLANYLQADKNALDRYTGLLGAGTQQANLAQNLQNQWMNPLLTGVGAYQNLGSTGLQSWGTAEKAAADAYAKMVQGAAGGVSQGLTGTDLGKTLGGLWDVFTGSNASGLFNTGNVTSETWT